MPARDTQVGENSPSSGPVIVGVDGSERSVDALALANVLGPALPRDVLVAHVHPFGELASLLAESEYEALVRDVAHATSLQIREYLPSVAEREMRIVSDTSPAAGLQRLAEREGAALVVIGSSSRSPIGRILAGGTGERLLSGAPAPVAVAPAGYAAAAGEIRTVGCGFDGSDESELALSWAAELARRTSARLRVLSAYERTLPATLAVGGGLATTSVNDVLRERRAKALARVVSQLGTDIEAEDLLTDGDGADVLARESGQLDLLVVGSRGYGPLRAVLLGSVSNELVRSAESPLVVVPRGSASAWPS